MKSKKLTKEDRRKAKRILIKQSWEKLNSKLIRRQEREIQKKDKRTINDVTLLSQAHEFNPKISYEDEILLLKKNCSRQELAKKHIEFRTKEVKSIGNKQAEAHYSKLVKEVRKLLDLN